MSQLRIQLPSGENAFAPGETITGEVSWDLPDSPEEAGLSLVWSTRGKGTTDIEVVETIPFSEPRARETRPFTIKLPDSPYTFSGQLISLIWNLELNTEPGGETESLEITIAPGGKEVLLPRPHPVK